jgi:glycosyltransferase involved in cell wall biosynthesis
MHYSLAMKISNSFNQLFNQTFQNFVLYIVNDLSTDDSLNKIKKYLPNPKIRLINNKKNGGCFYSKNTGIKLLETEDFDVYTTHDADDFSDSTRFEKIMDIFNNENIIALEDYELRIGGLVPDWYAKPGQIVPNHAHAFFSKKAFNILGYYDNFFCGADTDYWHRAIRYSKINSSYVVFRLPELLYYAQVTGNNMILKYGKEIRNTYFKKHTEEISKMKEDKDFYRPFFSIEEAIK